MVDKQCGKCRRLGATVNLPDGSPMCVDVYACAARRQDITHQTPCVWCNRTPTSRDINGRYECRDCLRKKAEEFVFARH